MFVTVATWVFRDRPDALQRVLEALWSKLPFVTAEFSAEVEQQVRDLTGQGWVLALSLIVTMWGTVGVVRVLQDTVNTIWGVPGTAVHGSSPSCYADSPSSHCSASASSAPLWSPASR